MFKIGFLLLSTIFVAGCATTSGNYIEPKELNGDNSAKVTIYRASYDYGSLTPEKPFFYVDQMYLGKLGSGELITFRLSPGEHLLSVKESFAFLPAFESGQVKGLFKAGANYYFLYTRIFRGDLPVGTGFDMPNGTTLLPATDEAYKARK
ncbi:MAG: hypothetical protein ACYC9L_12235 [Sulfuricaulis sp.]